MITNNTWKGLACVLGGFLVHFSLGTIYTFGNMSPYVASYLKFRTNNSWVTNGHLVWVFSMAVFSQGLIMALGGVIESKIGTRLTCLIGGWSMSLGTIITFFAIKYSLWLVIVTYGFVFGLGTGLTYSVAIAAPMKWFPAKKGLVAGAVVAGYGLGSLVFNFVQTKYINPDNIPPNSTDVNQKYFTSNEVLDRVPTCFLIIGFTYATLQFIGVMLMMDIKSRETENEIKTEKEKENSQNVILLKENKLADEGKTNTEETNLVENDDSAAANATTYTNESAVMDDFEEPRTSPDFTVLQAVKDSRLWILTSVFFFNGFFIVAVASFYKSFGQKFISDDRFMAIVGAVGALFNSGGRLLWGQLMDRFSYRIVMTILNILMAIFIGTFYTLTYISSENGSKTMFFIWVCCLFFCLSGTFAILPAATAQAFGNANMATIYGIIFSGYAISSLTGALIYGNFMSIIGFTGVFVVATIASFISLFISQFHKQPMLIKVSKNTEERLE